LFKKNKDIGDELFLLKSEYEKIKIQQKKSMDKISSLESVVSDLTGKIKVLEKKLEDTEKSKPVAASNSDIKLTPEQQQALTKLTTTDDNYFVTGKAGTGKSTLLRKLVEISDPKSTAVVAFTGAAALNVGGQTIHTFFRLSLGPQDVLNSDNIQSPPYIEDVLAVLKILIIDEISMVRSDILDMMDHKLRKVKDGNLPFGGCRIIAFGDPYQLPPIASSREEEKFIRLRYNTLHFFGAPGSKTFKRIELQNIMRQTDQRFIAALNEIRLGNPSAETLRYINASGRKDFPDNWTRLTLKKSVAAEINRKMLEKIPGEEFIFKAQFGGDDPPTRSDLTFEPVLNVKIGARVIAVKNDLQKRYVNGSIGIVVAVKDDEIIVNFNGVDIPVSTMLDEKAQYYYDRKKRELSKQIVGWCNQYPLKLAYAITVHKSQGQTFDNIILDFSGCTAFAPGQTYVALSRCKSLLGLRLTRPIDRRDVYVDPDITAYMNNQFQPRNEEDILVSKWMEEIELPFE